MLSCVRLKNYMGTTTVVVEALHNNITVLLPIDMLRNDMERVSYELP